MEFKKINYFKIINIFYYYCYFLQVLSGDSVKIWGAPRADGPPAERLLSLLGINAPKLARRPTNNELVFRGLLLQICNF